MLDKKGFFGFFRGIGSRSSAQDVQPVSAMNVQTDSPVSGAPISDKVQHFCKDRLQEILHLMGFSQARVEVSRVEGDQLYLDIQDDLEIGRIIGREGATLDALQILIRAIVFRQFDIGAKVFVDAGDYRSRRHESVKEMALKAVQSGRRRVVLRSMSASERRVVHALFQDDTTVKTYSIGRGEARHVVIEQIKESDAE